MKFKTDFEAFQAPTVYAVSLSQRVFISFWFSFVAEIFKYFFAWDFGTCSYLLNSLNKPDSLKRKCSTCFVRFHAMIIRSKYKCHILDKNFDLSYFTVV